MGDFCFNVSPTAKVIWGGSHGLQTEELGITLRTPGEKASGLSTKLQRLLRNKCAQRVLIVNKMQAMYLYKAAAV